MEKLRRINEIFRHEHYNAICISTWHIFTKSIQLKTGMVIRAYNPNIWKVETGGGGGCCCELKPARAGF